MTQACNYPPHMLGQNDLGRQTQNMSGIAGWTGRQAWDMGHGTRDMGHGHDATGAIRAATVMDKGRMVYK
ncbi:hypothetical protein E4U43_000576 [Claviceps pusilla]|uniref:Uncharacterized protein n=1 Tax=Claviceps pusilla TaxID=123648 RepID=A0A9P7NAG1_9HYPO|nr:hypothetical protein E4U43_000576 [Claviceps pusilla]